MSSNYDATEFVDSDFQPSHQASYPASAGDQQRALMREEVDSNLGETQQKLAELKRVQEELERERASLEETRRRQIEFQTGRQEMIKNLTRGIGLLEEAEFSARRDAEQMAKSLMDMRAALTKLEPLREDGLTTTELTRGLTCVENARMEWNSARLKFQVLSPSSTSAASPAQNNNNAPAQDLFAGRSITELCKVGLVLTWPMAVVAAVFALAIFLALMRHR